VRDLFSGGFTKERLNKSTDDAPETLSLKGI